MFSGLSQQKTNPLQNTQPTLNVLIQSSEVATYDKDPDGLQYRPLASKLVRTNTPRSNVPSMLVTTKFDSDHIPVGLAHGRGRVAANSSYNDVAMVTDGPATILMDTVLTAKDEHLVPGMLLYPLAHNGNLCVATERYMQANWKQQGSILAAAQAMGTAQDAAEAANRIISAYHTLVRPFALVIEHKPRSTYVNVLLGPY